MTPQARQDTRAALAERLAEIETTCRELAQFTEGVTATQAWMERAEAASEARALLTASDALEPLERLVLDLQAHAREHNWQDVDEPIAALLAWQADAREPQPAEPVPVVDLMDALRKALPK